MLIALSATTLSKLLLHSIQVLRGESKNKVIVGNFSPPSLIVAGRCYSFTGIGRMATSTATKVKRPSMAFWVKALRRERVARRMGDATDPARKHSFC